MAKWSKKSKFRLPYFCISFQLLVLWRLLTRGVSARIMRIEFTNAQKQTIAENIGFAVESDYVMEDDVNFFTNNGRHRASASACIDFRSKTIQMTVFYIDGYLAEEKKFTMDF